MTIAIEHSRVLLSLGVSMFVACSSTKFSAGSNQNKKSQEAVMVAPPASRVIDQVDPETRDDEPGDVVVPSIEAKIAESLLSLDCNELGIVERSIEIEENSDLSLTVSGEFCPKMQRADFVVSFIVDQSGSNMSKDPFLGGTCGRFEAIKGIVESFQNELGMGQDVRASLTGFSKIISRKTRYKS